MIGDSIYKNQAGLTHKWCPIDSKEIWDQNRKSSSNVELLDKLNWNEDSISYAFNSHGFRSDEFSGDGIVFLGCSLTAGIGMDLERTWTQIVSTTLGLKNWNLGQGGGSNDTCFRLGNHWIPLLKPKIVCMLSPSKYRLEIVTPERPETYLPNSDRSHKQKLYRDWLSTDVNGKLNATKNIRALQFLCNEHRIPFHYMTIDEALANGGSTHTDDWARDLIHPGSMWNKEIANKFLDIV